MCVVLRSFLGTVVFGLRGPYFAIGTLGVAIAAGQIAGTIDTIGGGAGISMPFFPWDIHYRSTFFYIICFVLAILSHFTIRWMFSTQFGLAANAIRDDEDKAEAMGIPTMKYKQFGWGVAAFYMGCIGAVLEIWLAISSRLRWPFRRQHLVSSWWQWRFSAARAPCGVRFLARFCSMLSKKLPGLICLGGSGWLLV